MNRPFFSVDSNDSKTLFDLIRKSLCTAKEHKNRSNHPKYGIN
jgi:hypothetical protein